MTADTPSGGQLLLMLTALASPHRLRILAALAHGRNYVSDLARQLQMNRPLLHMHLQRLEAAGLVTGVLELSDQGKAMKYYDVEPFDLHLSPQLIAVAARTLEDPATATQEEND
jgi:DNA-binding transcriptional ArsR family regulator